MHKALVPILGVPMLERNLCALLSEQFNDVVVSCSARETEIQHYLEYRGKDLLQSRGASLEVLREEQPLGTIGAASRLLSRHGPSLVVNVDNLTTLEYRSVLAHHIATAAMLTIAVHSEPFRIPFGVVNLRNGEVVDYVEKPTYGVPVSSGTYVLSAECLRMIPQGRRLDLPGLFSILAGREERVTAFEHRAFWIDVNDAAGVDRAEQLILNNYEDFELWKSPPHAEITETFFYHDRRVLKAGPHTVLEQQPRFLTAFDELCVPGGTLIRHKIGVLPAGAAQVGTDDQAWISLDGRSHIFDSTMQRCLAVLRHYL